MALPEYARGTSVLGTVSYLGAEIEVRSPTIADMTRLAEIWQGMRAVPAPRPGWFRRLLILLRLRRPPGPPPQDDYEIMAYVFPLLLVGWEDVTREDVDGLSYRDAVRLMLDVFKLAGAPEGKKPEAPGKS